MVIHQAHPIRKLPRAIHQPFTMNQITFTRKEAAPPPYSILLPNGQKDMTANLKHCKPYGIPTIVIHHKTPDRIQAIPLKKPPNINQQMLPNNLICLYPPQNFLFYFFMIFFLLKLSNTLFIMSHRASVPGKFFSSDHKYIMYPSIVIFSFRYFP